MPQLVDSGRHYLVLWRWEEAVPWEGEPGMNRSVGNQMSRVQPGDTLHIVATRKRELYLLNAIRVRTTGRKRSDDRLHFAKGDAISGVCRLTPLGRVKWRLRFQSAKSNRLRRDNGIGQQLQAIRLLTPESAELLLDMLTKAARIAEQVDKKDRINAARVFRQEGRRMEQSLSVRERDPAVRNGALEHFGRNCMVCGIDFRATYGDFAADCVEVHHLIPIGGRGQRGRRTEIDDVIVVCPNCHRAVHKWDDPADWRGLKKTCGL